MKKYRKLPVVIEAFQYDGDLMCADGQYYVPDWAKEAYEKGIIYFKNAGEMYIKTLEPEKCISKLLKATIMQEWEITSSKV